MKMWIVRHGHAGGREQWQGLDADRPLDRLGQMHALGLVGDLMPGQPRRLIASPTRRCHDTLEPLARATGRTVLTAPLLAEGVRTVEVVDFVNSQTDRTVMCTHGEVMRPLLAVLGHAGFDIRGSAVGDERFRKGVVWELDLGELTMVIRPSLEFVS